MLKIIIPLAGSSDTFINSGYSYPKPLIEIKGRIIIDWVIENPKLIRIPHKFIFIVLEEDVVKYHIDNTIRLLVPNSDIIKIKKQTKGGLCSVLMASDKLELNDSILILNGDQIINIDYNKVNEYWQTQKAEAGIITFESVHPRWSYARIEHHLVQETAEKNPISKSAIAGYYYFKNAKSFLENAFLSILNDNQLDGNYYFSPVLNQYILKGSRVLSYTILNEDYHSFYSPQMIREFDKL